jgi:hypothetical protein
MRTLQLFALKFSVKDVCLLTKNRLLIYLNFDQSARRIMGLERFSLWVAMSFGENYFGRPLPCVISFKE